MAQRTRHGYRPRYPQPPQSRVQVQDMTRGFDASRPPQNLSPGWTPEGRNFEYAGGFIRPRSNLSAYGGANNVADAVLFGMETFDIHGNHQGLTASSGTVSYMTSAAAQWSAMSWIAATGMSTQTPSAALRTGWQGAVAYDLAIDKNLVVLTDARTMPKFFHATDSATTFSDFTWVNSLFSRARSVAAHDARLVWFNVASSTSTFPQRVLWSDRGNAKGYTIGTDTSGFEDLLEMGGQGVRVVSERDGIVLFTTDEIWRGRTRTDIYAFDFYRVTNKTGCQAARTIAQTPHGIAFLGSDHELYLLRGDDLVPLGNRPDDATGGGSRVQEYLRANLRNGHLAWGVYNSAYRRYELYTSMAGSGVYPRWCLYYSFDNASIHWQVFEHGLTAGFEYHDVAAANRLTWDEVGSYWDEYGLTWDSPSLGVPATRVVVGSSAGTHMAYDSTATNDAGQTMEARWRSHGVEQYGLDLLTLNECRLNYAADSAYSIGVLALDDNGGAVSHQTFPVSAASNGVALLPVTVTAQSPSIEFRVTDGSRPKFAKLDMRSTHAGQYSG